MATIYSVPKQVKVPSFDFKTWKKDEEDFIKKLKQFCLLKNAKGKYVGKELRLPHADGYARYMVSSEKPFELIHIPLGDAWDSPLVDGLSVKKIKELIDADEKLAKLFN